MLTDFSDDFDAIPSVKVSIEVCVQVCVYEFIKLDDDEEIDNQPYPYPQLQEAVRRVTLARLAVPVLCGSSLKNKCVQPLLDAITAYLPDPDERHNDLV